MSQKTQPVSVIPSPHHTTLSTSPSPFTHPSLNSATPRIFILSMSQHATCTLLTHNNALIAAYVNEKYSRKYNLALPHAAKDMANSGGSASDPKWLSLHDHLINNTPNTFPVPTLLSLFKSCLESLERLHKESILHLNIAPRHVQLKVGLDGSIQEAHLTHFHYAQIINNRNSRIQPNTHVLPRNLHDLLYASPEATQKSTDADQVMDFRADIYSLGAIFYRIITGRDLFGHCLTYEDLVDAHNYTELPNMRELMQESTPSVILDMIGHMLEKMPTQRYSSATEILHQIRLFEEAIQRMPHNPFDALKTLTLNSSSHIKLLITNSRNQPQLFISPLNCSRKNQYKTIEKTFLKSRSGTPGVVLISGVPGIGKKNAFHLLSGQYRYSCLFASTFFAEKSVAHAPLVYLACQVVDQSLRCPEHNFERISHLVREHLDKSHEQILMSMIPEVSVLFGRESSTSAYLPEPETSSALGDALCAFLTLFCTEDRHLCVFVDRIDLVGTFCWKVFESLLRPNHNFLLIGSCGASKEERLIVKANYRRLRKSGVHVNNCQLDVPKTSALKSMILSTLMGVPCTSDETQHASHALMSPVTTPTSASSFPSSNSFPTPDDNFRSFAEAIISKSNNKPIMVIEILLYLKELGLIVPAQQSMSTASSSTSKHGSPHYLWTPRWKECIVHLSTVAPNFIAKNFQKLPPVTQQILEIAAVLDAPFTLADLSRFTKKDSVQVFEDLFPALSEGWIVREGSSYVFAHNRYMKTVLGQMDKPKINHYLDEIITETLSHLMEERMLVFSDYIFHVIQWITTRIASGKEETSSTSFNASVKINNAIVKDYLEDYAHLTTIASRKLLAANLPKTANNFAAQVYDVLENSRLTIDKAIQFELDYVFCRVQFAMGNFTKTHQMATKMIDLRDTNPNQLMRVFSILLVNGLACGKHNEVMELFLKRCNQVRLLAGYSDESSVKTMIAQKLSKLESVLMAHNSVEKLMALFSQETPTAVLDTDSLDADLKTLIEAEGLVQMCNVTSMQHYVLFGLTCLEYVLESRHFRPSTAVAVMYGAIALNHLYLSPQSPFNSKLTPQHLNTLFSFANKARELQMSTLRYTIKFQRLQLSANPSISFTEQHQQLVEMHKECNNSKEPNFLVDFQDLLVSCLSGVHATDIFSTLNMYRSQQALLKHNPARTQEILVIAAAAKQYIDGLQDHSFHMQQQQVNASTGNTLSVSTPMPATLTSSVTPETPTSLIAQMSFVDPMKFAPLCDNYGLIHTFALGRLSHHLFSALFFFATNQSTNALREIQKVMAARDVVGGNIIDELISFFIVRIASEQYQTTNSDKLRAELLQLITNETRASERYISPAGKSVHYYCRAKVLKCNSKSMIDIQYLQLLQKSIRLAHEYNFRFLVGVVSVHLVETFQELDFSATLIHSTMTDALEAWKSIGGTRLLRKIREKHSNIVVKMSKLKPSPVVLPSLETMTQLVAHQDAADTYFLQCLSVNGIDVSSLTNTNATISQEMTVVSLSIRQFDKVIHHKSAQEIYDIVAEYISRVGLVLRKYHALYEVHQGSRIVAYFPNSIRNALQAIVEINDSIRDLQQGRMSKPNSAFIRVAAGMHHTNVIIGHLNRDVKPEFGRLDTNFGAIFCSTIEQVLWFEELANTFNLTAIGSDTISDFIGDSNDLCSRFLGKFKVENANSGSGQVSEPALSIYEIYAKDWKKGINYREFNRAIQMFREKKFVSCSNIFTRVSKGSYSSDGLPDHVAKLYVDVCRMYKQLTLPENWDGEVLLTTDVKPLPVGTQNSSFYLQRGISTVFSENDEGSDKTPKDSHMLQQTLDQKNASLNALNDLLLQKEDVIVDLQYQRDTLESENSALQAQVNKLRSELSKEQRIRRKTERKNIVLTSHNGGFKFLGFIPVPSALLASPTEKRKSSNRVHNLEEAMGDQKLDSSGRSPRKESNASTVSSSGLSKQVKPAAQKQRF